MSDLRKNKDQEEKEETATNPQPGGNSAPEPPEDDTEPGGDGKEAQTRGLNPGESRWSTGQPGI